MKWTLFDLGRIGSSFDFLGLFVYWVRNSEYSGKASVKEMDTLWLLRIGTSCTSFLIGWGCLTCKRTGIFLVGEACFSGFSGISNRMLLLNFLLAIISFSASLVSVLWDRADGLPEVFWMKAAVGDISVLLFRTFPGKCAGSSSVYNSSGSILANWKALVSFI